MRDDNKIRPVAWTRHDAAAIAYRRRFGLEEGVLGLDSARRDPE